MSDEENAVVKAVRPAASGTLKQLMDAAEVTTFVPLARSVGIKPQQLYSRRDKNTGEYRYDSIEIYLLRFGEGKTIEEIVELARQRVTNKVIRTKRTDEGRKEAKLQKAKEREIRMLAFQVGSRVTYSTYRVHEGVREDYDVFATVKDVTETHLVLVRDADGAETTMAKTTAVKKLNLIAAVPEENQATE